MVAAVHLITFVYLPRKTYTSLVFSVCRRARRFLRSLCIGIFDRKILHRGVKNVPYTSLFLSLLFFFTALVLCVWYVINIDPDEPTAAGHKLTVELNDLFVYYRAGPAPLKGICVSSSIISARCMKFIYSFQYYLFAILRAAINSTISAWTLLHLNLQNYVPLYLELRSRRG